MVSLVRQTVEGLGYHHMEMISGAGHDAMNLSLVVPTAMIFVPCKDGISLNLAESITPEQAFAGVDVMLKTVVTLANLN